MLTVSDWIDLAKRKIAEVKKRMPEEVVSIDNDNVPVFELQLNKLGQPYRGMGINVKDVEDFKAHRIISQRISDNKLPA